MLIILSLPSSCCPRVLIRFCKDLGVLLPASGVFEDDCSSHLIPENVSEVDQDKFTADTGIIGGMRVNEILRVNNSALDTVNDWILDHLDLLSLDLKVVFDRGASKL